MKSVFLNALPILHKLKEEGYQAYFVGGSVRDSLLEREIGDVDIATSAAPDEVQRIFPKTVDVGAAHGTVIVIYKGTPYEVTTFRTEEGYKDARRPDKVSFVQEISEDLKRRDFTVNAMAMDGDGKLIDFYGGREDLKKRIIRTVGDPAERFSEDGLRMMRAVRFVSQLGFRLSNEAKNAIIEKNALLQKISIERKLAEFDKLLLGKNRDEAILLLLETGIEEHLPFLNGQKEALLRFARHEKGALSSLNEMWMLLLYELHFSDPARFLKSWKMPMKRIKHLQHGVSILEKRRQEGWTSWLLYHAGNKAAIEAEACCLALEGETSRKRALKVEEAFRSLPIKNRSELAVTGEDLLNWTGKKPGPWISEMLEDAEQAVLSQKIGNSKTEIKEWVFRCSSQK